MESDPRLAGPGTVRAWEETSIAGSISRRLSSFRGLLDLCAAPLLECVHGMSGEGSPSSPVISAGLKLLGDNFCSDVEIGTASKLCFPWFSDRHISDVEIRTASKLCYPRFSDRHTYQ